MTPRALSLLGVALSLVVAAAPGAAQERVTELSTLQRDSAGIATARPPMAQLPTQQAALGLVLDPAVLVSEHGQLAAAQAAERAASADLQRLQGLYRAEASSSLRMVQTAEAEHTRAQTQYLAALAAFNEHWSALTSLPAGELGHLLERVSEGSQLLVRASLPGRQSVGALPQQAWLEVDGIRVAAHVLGALRQGSAELQSAAWLLEVGSAPHGLGPGARIPVTLLYPARRGAVLPDQAVLYAERGPRVYTQLASSGADHWRFTETPVELLQRLPQGWLVRGVESDDLVVVQGAGALWSLAQQQPAGAARDEDDDD